MHPAAAFIYGTPWEAKTLDDLGCELEPDTSPIPHGLFKLSHHLTNPTSSAELASEANAAAALTAHISTCTEALGHRVNLLSVDFYSTGDVLEVVAGMNDGL